MKKSLFTLAFLCFAVVSFGGTFDLGLKAGMNSAKFTLNQTAEQIKADAKAGYEFGAFMRMGGKNLYFQPEVNFVTKNSTVTNQTSTSTITYTTKYNSVQVPLLAGLQFLNIKAASLHVITGPAISFAPNATIDDVKSNLENKSAWTWQLGAGVDILIFTVNLRYEWGLSDFTVENVQNTVFQDGKTFTVSLGIKLF